MYYISTKHDQAQERHIRIDVICQTEESHVLARIRTTYILYVPMYLPIEPRTPMRPLAY